MYMTERGFARLEAELERLQEEDLATQVDYIHDASADGDSMDNSELLMLRDELSFIEGRIRELKNILNNAELIKRGGA